VLSTEEILKGEFGSKGNGCTPRDYQSWCES